MPDSDARVGEYGSRRSVTVGLWWLALFGVWPLADPGHEDLSSPLVLLDLALHFIAAGLLLNRWADGRAANVRTLGDLRRRFPNAHIEEVGDRRELVIYTGWSVATYDDEADEWTDTPSGRVVPMPEFLD